MFDKLPAKIVRLEMVLRAKRVDDPHLVAGAAGGNVKPLLEEFLVAKRKWTVLCRIDKRDENYITFVTLELRGVPAEDAMKLVTLGRNVPAKKIVNFDGLLIANERDNSKTERLTRFIRFVLRLFHRRSKKGSHRKGFLKVDLAVAA